MSSRLDQWFAVRESKVIFLVSCVLLFYSLCFLSGSLSCSLCLFSCSVFFVFVFLFLYLDPRLSLSLSFLLVFAPYLPRIMIRSETLCFGWIGTPTVLPVLDRWWRFPRPAGTLWRWRKVGWKGVRW